MSANRALEFRSGWAEKRMSGWRKMLAQTEATRRTMPACAITAVPGEVLIVTNVKRKGKDVPIMRLWCSGCRACCEASPIRPRRGSSSPKSESRRILASGIPVAEAML